MKDEVKLLLFSGFVLAVSYASSFLFELPVLLLLILTGYFTLFCLFMNRRLDKAMTDENKNKFTYTFMAFSGLKMLCSLVLIIFLLYFFKEGKLSNGVCAMIFYLLYTFFEVYLWMSKLKKASAK